MVKNIIAWVEAYLNLNKTHYLVLTNRKKDAQLNVKAKDITVSRTTSAKLLGVIFDDKLTFEEHINSLVSKLSNANYAFLKVEDSVHKYICNVIDNY